MHHVEVAFGVFSYLIDWLVFSSRTEASNAIAGSPITG